MLSKLNLIAVRISRYRYFLYFLAALGVVIVVFYAFLAPNQKYLVAGAVGLSWIMLLNAFVLAFVTPYPVFKDAPTLFMKIKLILMYVWAYFVAAAFIVASLAIAAFTLKGIRVLIN